MKKSGLIFGGLLAAMILLCAGCANTVTAGTTGTVVAPSGIAVDKTSLGFDLSEGNATSTLTATLQPADVTAGYDGIIWESDNPAVATVDGNGKTVFQRRKRKTPLQRNGV